MEKKIIFRIDKETKDKFYKISRIEGKSASNKMRELIAEYIAENDLSSIVDDLWDRISIKLKAKNISEKDIEKATIDVRKDN